MDYTKLDRSEQNKILRQHGYRWEKITQDWLDDNDEFDKEPGWYLYSKDGREVSVERAFREIEIGVKETEKEIQAAEDEARRVQAVKQELKRLKREVSDEIQKCGIRPEGDNTPEGVRLLDTQDIYGGGDWFVVGEKEIWYVRNNGMDGDNWSHNNVLTGGAGAIGWKIPMDPKIKEILLSLEDGSLKQKLLSETATPVKGYLILTKLVDMNGEHVHEIGRAEKTYEVEKLIDDFLHPLIYEGLDSVDREMIDNLEILYNGRPVGKCNRNWQVIWY